MCVSDNNSRTLAPNRDTSVFFEFSERPEGGDWAAPIGFVLGGVRFATSVQS